MPKKPPYRLLGTLAGVSMLAAAATAIHPSWRDVEVQLGQGSRLQIGSLATNVSFLGAALAQSVDRVVLENVVLDLGGTTYRAPRVEVVGTGLSAAELSKIFEPQSRESLAVRLARLSAKELRIQELVAEQKVDGQRRITRYRDVVASNVDGGRLETLIAHSASTEVQQDGRTDLTGTAGRISASGLDLGQVARLYTEKAGPETGELKRIYSGFSAENLVFLHENGTEIRLARLSGKDFAARALKGSLGQATEELGDEENERSEVDSRRMLDLAAEIFGAFDIGSLEAVGFEVKNPRQLEQSTIRLARIAYAGPGANQPADIRLEGLDVTTQGGAIRAESLAFTGFSLQPTIERLRATSGSALDELEPEDLYGLIPAVGSIRASGIQMEARSEKADTVRAALRAFELTAQNPVNQIPTKIATVLEGLSLSIPSDAQDETLKSLLALGYTSLDLSVRAASQWDEAKAEMTVDDIVLSGADLGRVSIRGALGNITRDAFHLDEAVATVAWISANIKNAEIVVENNGLMDRYLANEARKLKKSPEDLRREYGTAAAIAIPAVLGSSPTAKAIGQAVARFIAKPGRLTISARAKDDSGIGIADLAAVDGPAALLDKVEVNARAD